MAKRKKRITKKELKRDRFVEAGGRALIYWRHHRERVIAIVVGIVVCIAGIESYFYLRSKSSDTAKSLFSKGENAYFQNDIETAKIDFETASKNYPRTEPGKKATYYLGNICYFSGKYDDAIKYYKKYLSLSKDKILAPSALMGIAASYSQQGNHTLAIEKYLEVKKKFKNTIFAPISLMKAAEIAQVTGDIEKAKSLYTEVTENYKETDLTQSAREKLSLLGGMSSNLLPEISPPLKTIHP
jgi:TolA-binding protein